MVHALEGDEYREKMKDVLAQVRNVRFLMLGLGWDSERWCMMYGIICIEVHMHTTMTFSWTF
jgi:hypothetical protein